MPRIWDAAQVIVHFDSGPVDVTTYLRNGSVTRSRRPGGPTLAGNTQLELKNNTRAFDPPWAGATPGPFGAIRSGQRVQVFYDVEQVLEAHIDDWDHAWPPGEMPTATIKASDTLARLAQRDIDDHIADPAVNGWQAPYGQRIGTRLTSLLALPEVDWAGATDFDLGAMNLQHDIVDAGTNVLSYIQQLERTDGGRFFVSRTGTLTYRALNLPGAVPIAATFTDGTGDIDGIHGIVVSYGTEQWYTQVNATRVGGKRQSVSSSSLIRDQHGGGYRPLNLDSLLMTTDAGAMNLAGYWLSVYEEPTPIVTGLKCIMEDLPDADALAVARLEQSDRVVVTWTPARTGSPVSQTLAVEGIADSIERTKWTRTISLSQLIGIPGWVIGNNPLGTIGTGILGV